MSEINKAQAYFVQIQELDEQLEKEPASLIDLAQKGNGKPFFRESHPALYMPKHNYRKYKMKGRQDESCLNVLKEKPKLKD